MLIYGENRLQVRCSTILKDSTQPGFSQSELINGFLEFSIRYFADQGWEVLGWDNVVVRDGFVGGDVRTMRCTNPFIDGFVAE